MIVLPKNDVEKQVILSRIATKMQIGKVYSEQEINELIMSFRVEDHVLVRRELVNFGYLNKDSYKGLYSLKRSRLLSEDLERIKKNQNKMKKDEVY